MDVSVVIPTFNRGHLLKRALRSVIGQSMPPREIIVVDDGSTDETGEMIRECFPSVRYIHQTNKGVSSARNQGIEAAGEEWLAFLDSDDEWLPDKLQQQCESLTQQPNYKICHTDEVWIRRGRRVNPMRKHAKQGGWIFKNCLPLCVISPSSVLIHRTLFNQVGTFDETLPACEDYDLWLRICAFYPVLYLTEKLTLKYGGHEDQLSRRHWGMDRFRIHALENLIMAGSLDSDNKMAVIDMILQKAAIVLKGAHKHNNDRLRAEYSAKITHFKKLQQRTNKELRPESIVQGIL